MMHGASRPSLQSTSSSSVQQQASAVARAPPSETTLTIPLSECCESRTPPLSFGPRSTIFSSSVTAPITSSGGSSETNRPVPPLSSAPSSARSFPIFGIVAIVVGALLLLLGAALIYCIYHRRRRHRYQRRNVGKEGEMYYPGEYQTVPVNHPGTPPSDHSPSGSSVSTQALLDLGLYEGDDANEYTFVMPPVPTVVAQTQTPPQTPPQSPPQDDDYALFKKGGLWSPKRDRRSVDTIFALRFYYTHNLDRRSKGSFLADLPSSPPLPPVVPDLPTNPPPPIPLEHQQEETKPPPSRGSRTAKRKDSYVTPAGEPWKPLPPPEAPLPPPPPATASSGPGHKRRSTNPTFSLFPAPPKAPPKPTFTKNLNSSRAVGNLNGLGISPVPAPLRLPPKSSSSQPVAPLKSNPFLPPTSRTRGSSGGPRSAPLPVITDSSPVEPTASSSMATEIGTISIVPMPSAPGTAPLPSTARFNEGVLTPELQAGSFPPPPSSSGRRGFQIGHRTRRSLPTNSVLGSAVTNTPAGRRWFSGWRSPKMIS
ncbi:hypothetical protein QBC35DRAFT_160416 [Podospora australis]|uniref:Uncharacterized protein n=1 Tax=Podospora australis TaxID=1536484 RepID=A0AAN7AMW0_9PEZI|nr:hypothetical protein QBC35DRAFT_160416 [Podospora australis]